MEIYINDMLIKSTKETNHIINLKEAFNNLHDHQIKLNLRKCTFSIMAGKFLGFMITRRDIKDNLEKI